MSQVKILEKNADQITFKVGEQFNPSVVFIVMVTVLVLGGLMLLVPIWISDIVDGNSSSLFTLVLFVGCFASISSIKHLINTSISKLIKLKCFKKVELGNKKLQKVLIIS